MAENDVPKTNINYSLRCSEIAFVSPGVKYLSSGFTHVVSVLELLEQKSIEALKWSVHIVNDSA